jgi:hypothetical protein
MARRLSASAARSDAAALSAAAEEPEYEDDDAFAAAVLPLQLADPVPFRRAAVVYAADAADYSFMVLQRDGQIRWPVVAITRAGDVLLLAWPAAAGPQFGGSHVRARVRAADMDDPLIADEVTLEVELELIGIEDVDELLVVAVLPALDPALRFTSENGVPFAEDLMAAASERAARALAGPLAGGTPGDAVIQAPVGAATPVPPLRWVQHSFLLVEVS